MKKADRQKIFDKYGGRCAYCGCELTARWHADHMNPIHRKTKYVGGNFVTKDTGLEPTEEDIESCNYMQVPRKIVQNGCHHPERDVIENLFPACVSCNNYKHSADLETFRRIIGRTVTSLSKQSTQYKFGKRYGLIQETEIEVKFYFETLVVTEQNQQP